MLKAGDEELDATFTCDCQWGPIPGSRDDVCEVASMSDGVESLGTGDRASLRGLLFVTAALDSGLGEVSHSLIGQATRDDGDAVSSVGRLQNGAMTGEG